MLDDLAAALGAGADTVAVSVATRGNLDNALARARSMLDATLAPVLDRLTERSAWRAPADELERGAPEGFALVAAADLVAAFEPLPADSGVAPAAPGRPPGMASPSKALALARAQLHRDSPILQHSARVAVAGGIAVSLMPLVDPSNGAWMASGAVMVLKPDFGSTARSAVQRAIGTSAGAALAGGLAAVTGSKPLLIAAAFLLTLFAEAIAAVNAALFAACIAPLSVLLVNVAQPGDWEIAITRARDIAFGSVIAIVVGYFVFRRWARDALPGRLAALLRADAAWTQEAMQRLAVQDTAGEPAARGAESVGVKAVGAEAVEAADVALQAAIAQTLADPPPLRGQVRAAREALDANATLVAALDALAWPDSADLPPRPVAAVADGFAGELTALAGRVEQSTEPTEPTEPSRTGRSRPCRASLSTSPAPRER